VGELTQWALVRDLGARRRSELQVYIATRVKIPGGSDVGRKWGEITAYAQRRGRPRPINDSWMLTCAIARVDNAGVDPRSDDGGWPTCAAKNPTCCSTGCGGV